MNIMSQPRLSLTSSQSFPLNPQRLVKTSYKPQQNSRQVTFGKIRLLPALIAFLLSMTGVGVAKAQQVFKRNLTTENISQNEKNGPVQALIDNFERSYTASTVRPGLNKPTLYFSNKKINGFYHRMALSQDLNEKWSAEIEQFDSVEDMNEGVNPKAEMMLEFNKGNSSVVNYSVRGITSAYTGQIDLRKENLSSVF